MALDAHPGVSLEVDGGIDATTARAVVDAGAGVLVAGKSIFGARDIPAAVRALRAAALGT
jgi:ribulose-phosphate 3-epimerase